MKNSHLAIGIASSVVLGAVLGILFAPDKGSNTRKKITQKSNDIKNSIKDSIDNLASTVEDKYNQITSKLSNVDTSNVGDMVDEAKDKAMNLKHNMKPQQQ